MGGGVFTTPTFQSRRVELKEFLEIKQDLIDLFSKNNLWLSFGDYVRDKTSFGDLDIIIYQDLDVFIKVLKDNNFKYSQNSNVLSFLYKDFQIDLIRVDYAILTYAIQYYSWNDIHNLTGKLCKKLGFKHGQNGLEYVIRDHTLNSDNRIKDTIFLSSDPYKHLEIIGLSVERYKQGFENVEEMFDYIATSPYFDPSIYQLSELTNKDRVRDRKRVNFQKFLAYCETKKGHTPTIVFPEDRSVTPLLHFPWLKTEIDRVYAEVEYLNKLKEKLNGNTILALYPTMSGKDVGKMITGLKALYSPEYWLWNKPEDIDDVIKVYVEQHLGIRYIPIK